VTEFPTVDGEPEDLRVVVVGKVRSTVSLKGAALPPTKFVSPEYTAVIE
jgi:hypothetical protein